ncbi:MAG: 50S ribosomal protein L32 [Deltaproteobacteria bacterium]|nr:50S ribosomal protein L32 [Deltaproteobacteria bacterium]
MAVPKRRTSRGKRKSRRANHDRITAPTVVACPQCGEPMRPHRVCAKCGTYKGREVLRTEQEGAEE